MPGPAVPRAPRGLPGLQLPAGSGAAPAHCGAAGMIAAGRSRRRFRWARGQKAEPRAAEGGAGSGASGKAGVPGTTIGGRGYGVKANGGGQGPWDPLGDSFKLLETS